MTSRLLPPGFEKAVAILRQSSSVVVFTGAGISAESGIPTFRDGGGLWDQFPVEEFGQWAGLWQTALRRPEELARYLVVRLEPMACARPNAAHRAIAEMEKFAQVTVVTQNIDGLHQEAGSRRVLEIHGCLLRVVWVIDRKLKTELTRSDLAEVAAKVRQLLDAGRISFRHLLSVVRPLFGFGLRGWYRPDVVLFGDAMAEPEWSQAVRAASQCDVVLSVGTSGQVFPAATIPWLAKSRGATWIHVDPKESAGDIWLPARAGEILPALIEEAWGRL